MFSGVPGNGYPLCFSGFLNDCIFRIVHANGKQRGLALNFGSKLHGPIVLLAEAARKPYPCAIPIDIVAYIYDNHFGKTVVQIDACEAAMLTTQIGFNEATIPPNPDSFSAICKDCGNGTLNNAVMPAFKILGGFDPYLDEIYIVCGACHSHHVKVMEL